MNERALPAHLTPERMPNYWQVFVTFARNSLVRDMTFRANFIIESLSTITWTLMDLGFYLLIFQFTQSIGPGWGKYEFFAFLATTKFVNAIVQAFFMPNCEEISELIRTGGLDFALLKPIDTQFLVSLRKIDWSALSHALVGAILVIVSLWHLTTRDTEPLLWWQVASALPLYVFYVACGSAILYSLMIGLAATSIWLGQNRSLYDFWFYITNFSRYPMEIYDGAWGLPLRYVCLYVVPVLVVVNVPARILAQPLYPEPSVGVPLALFAIVATAGCLVISRLVFQRALRSYRSASS
ncbi:MAG TPA: ABC-2 family transporter protein [Pirellulaceae bacterium]|nr:ABC-2 family transporter protein [Pirellulaceae bacterium]